MEQNVTIDEIHEIINEILLYFKNFCDKNNIAFFLSNGTLLGAVKYRGIIPWDDDIDVLVPREDYDRIIRIFQDTEKYRLFSPERTPEFLFPYAKLCDMTTRKEETNINNGVELGLDIDIFPLDNFPGDYSAAKAQVDKINNIQKKLNFAKLKYNPGKNLFRTVIKTVCIFFHHCVGAKFYVRKITDIISENKNVQQPEYSGCAIWPVYGKKEIIPAEVFEKTVEVEFEGEKYPAPSGYDRYLRSLYGDYEKDLPADKQKSHHGFKACRL